MMRCHFTCCYLLHFHLSKAEAAAVTEDEQGTRIFFECQFGNTSFCPKKGGGKKLARKGDKERLAGQGAFFTLLSTFPKKRLCQLQWPKNAGFFFCETDLSPHNRLLDRKDRYCQVQPRKFFKNSSGFSFSGSPAVFFRRLLIY